jgi:hypothetical protein
MAASALTRFGVFEAGRASARDAKYTVGPQRQRRREQASRPPDASGKPRGRPPGRFQLRSAGPARECGCLDGRGFSGPGGG